MALIKCPECGKENVSDTAKTCPNCGFIFTHMKKRDKKIFAVVGGVAAFVVILLVVKLLLSGTSPAGKATKIIETDLGYSIDVINIYYNEEQQGCVVEFYGNGIKETACVYLDDNKVGYESIYNQYIEQSNNAVTNEEKQKCAQRVVAYPYNVYWILNLTMNGTNDESGWEKIK